MRLQIGKLNSMANLMRDALTTLRGAFGKVSYPGDNQISLTPGVEIVRVLKGIDWQNQADFPF